MPDDSNTTNPTNPSVETLEKSDTSVDFKAEFGQYLQKASLIPKSEVVICRTNTDRMGANIRIGVTSISSEEIIERIRRELPTVVIEELIDLTRLGETVAHAARVVSPPARSVEISAAVTRGGSIRRSLFSQIQVLVDAGIIKGEEFEPMHKGKGIMALANDLIDAAALFKRHETEIAGKVAVKPELIAEGRELGVYLRKHVAPASSVKNQSVDKSTAAETRDLLWTLLVRRHQELRRVAAWLWLDEADKHVPPLRAFQRKKKSQETPATTVTAIVPMKPS